MKRLRVVFAVSSALALLAACAFANNVVAIVRWWRAFLASGGDTAGIPAHVPGLFPWLDWSAVDYSAVTTLIPLLGFASLARGAWRLLRGCVIDHADDFPFFRGSDQLNVALGLFGTLWGIIVIGYFKLDTVTMADLVQCLHTALFSTLMAVVWVFLVDRPLLRPFFQRLLSASGLARLEDGDLAGAVERLVGRLGAATEAFARRQAQFEADIERRQAQFEAEAELRRAAANSAAAEQRTATAASVAQALDGLERARKETAEQCARQLADYRRAFEARQREYVEFFRREIDRLEKRAQDSASRLQAVAQALRT